MTSRLKTTLKVIVSGMLLLLVVLGHLVTMSQPTSAAPSDNEIMQKALVNAIDECYSSTYIYDDLTPSGRFTTEDMFKYGSRKDGGIVVLDSFGGTMSCKETFVGSNAGAGLNGLFNKNPTSPSDLGYTQKTDNSVSGTRCMSISYKHPDSTGVVRDYTSNELCFGVKEDNGQAIVDTESFPSGAIIPSDCRDFLCLSTNIHGAVVVGFYSDSSGLYGSFDAGYYDTEMWTGGPGTAWDSLLNEVNTNVANILNGQEKFHDVSAKLGSQTSQPGAFAAYEITNYATAAGVARHYYAGDRDMLFNNDDVRYLFDKAYEQMKSDGTVNEGTCYVGKPDAVAQSGYAHYDKSSNMWCTVYLNNPNSRYKAVKNDMKHLTTATAEFILQQLTNRNEGSNESGEEICRKAAQERLEEFRQAIIEENKKGDQADKTKLDYYKKSQAEIRQLLRTSSSLVTSAGQCESLPTVNGAPDKPPIVSGDNTSTNPGNGSQVPDIENNDEFDISACKKATSLGWVVCPFMSLVGKAAMGMYNQLSGTWLTIDADEVSTSGPLYESWKQFRDYANIAFAILFAIVVFSQVSGIGLSNYSIKKMLPTLIMVAVLVNISFFICQLAIDVTNIVGVGIGEVLEHIGNVAIGASDGRSIGETAGYITAGLLTAAGIGVGGYLAAPIVVASIGTIIIPVILAVISGLIGYFFLLILMALRKAILYIVIITSPLAFICYALPNTKSLFDKWKKLFMNLLLVFPICQILVYGGQMMSKIMMAGDENSFFFQFTAMLLQIVPIFFIPMVLRNSMSMLGNIGTRVSQMGAKVGHGLSGAIGRTQLASRASIGFNKWGANRLMKSSRMTRTPKTALGRMSQANSRARISSALTKAEELRQSDNRASNITSEGFMDNVAASADIKAKEEAADNYISGLLTGAVTDENGKAYDMNDIRHEVAGEGEDGDLVRLYDQALRSNDETKIKALSKYLMNIKGGKGLSVIASAMRKRGGAAFRADGSLRGHDDKERRGFNTAAKYLTGNEKWNVMTKKWDPNMTNLLADGSMDSDDKITNRGTGAWAYYNAGAAGKSTPAQMINHDDSYFDGIKNVYGSEAGYEALNAQGSVGEELRNSLDSYHLNAQAVFDNPRVYSQAGGALRDIQNVSNAHQAYTETFNRLEQEAQANNTNAKFAEIHAKVKKEMKDKYKKMGPSNEIDVDHRKGK